MCRVLSVSMCLMAFVFGLGLTGCNSGSGGLGDAGLDAGPADAGPADDGPLDASTEPDAGPPPALDPFVIRMQADGRIGVAGQAFRIEASAGGEVPDDIEWRWTAPTGEGEADGSAYTVRFDAEGPHEVEVEAVADGQTVKSGVVIMIFQPFPVLGDVDGDGATAEDDLELLRAFLAADAVLDDAAEARADLNRDLEVDAIDAALLEALLAGDSPRFVEPTAGSRGTLVRIAHPTLLDPAARFTATFDGAVVPLDRGMPGFATIIVPLEADSAAAATLALHLDDAVIDTFDFALLDPPTVEGDELPRTLERLQGAVELMPALIDAYLTDLDVPAEDRALMTAMFQAVAEQLALQRSEFAALWSQLTPEQQAIYTEVALANGLDEALANLDDIAARIRAGMPQITTEGLIELVCLARDLGKVSKGIAQVNAIAGHVIDALWFLSFFVPPLAPVVAGLSTASALIGAVMDVMQLLLEFVPRFGDAIDLMATPAALDRGQETTITATIKVQIAGGLCAGGAGVATKLIFDKIKDRLFTRLFGGIPGFGRLYRRARNQRTMIARLVTGIARFMGQILDIILDRTGIEDRFKDMAAAVCNAIVPGQPWDLNSGGLDWSAGCGTVDAGVWACAQECADRSPRITARRRICGALVEGSVAVACAGCRAMCPDGCCTADGACVDLADQDLEQCGDDGRRCGACGEDQVCDDGACQCVSTCEEDDLGALRCADQATAETCTAAGDGCFRWTPTDCAAGGATCEEGVCVGGCGGWNCEGCCTGEHACVGIDEQDEQGCGSGGGGCAICAQGDVCLAGQCACRGPDCDPPLNAGSRGDPHLTTFDGLGYDFQGAGEFVLAADPISEGAAAFEVQVRQVPLANPLCAASATVNRAVALQVGESRLTFNPCRAQPIWLDGVAIDPPENLPWPIGDAQLRVSARGAIQVIWADGSEVRMTNRFSIDVGVAPAAGRAVIGLLGDRDGDSANDLRLVNGTVVERPVPFETLYGAFADSWRVTPDTRLFDDLPGEELETWIVPGFPAALAEVDSLDAEGRAAAEAECGDLGIVDPVLLDACVLDTVCSGAVAAGLVGLAAPTDQLEVLPPEIAPDNACNIEPRNLNDAEPGALFNFVCPARCVDAVCTVWGTDVYTDDSCLCSAAIHAGVIGPEGGMLRGQHLEGRDAYTGSLRNGVQTRDYGSWDGSFQFPDAIPACSRTGADFLTFEPAEGCREGAWYCHDCPADCGAAPVWGNDTYHEQSSLCAAAVHAGQITAADGGRVVFEFPFFEEPYVGSLRNGIESVDRDAHPVGIVFRE